MNVFEYRAMCAAEIEEAEKALVYKKAKVAAIDEMVALGVITENNDVADEVEETAEVADQETATSVGGIY